MTAEHAVTTIRINSNELDIGFVEGIKKLFPNQQICVTVEGGAMDETEFVLSKPHLLQSIQKSEVDFESGKVRSFDGDSFREYVQNTGK